MTPVAAILAAPLLFSLLAWPALRENSATYDETAFIAAGFTYVTRGDFRLVLGHPPLAADLVALPVAALHPAVGADAERAFAAAPGPRDNAVWVFGDRFLYRDNPTEALVFRARLVTLLVAAVLVAVVSAWAGELFGPAGALLAGTLLALDPNLLAHGTLATTDVYGAALFCLAVYFVRRTFRALTIANALAAGLAIGLALDAKFTSVLLAPVCALLALLRLRREDPWALGTRGRTLVTARDRSVALLVLVLAWVVLSITSIWAIYGFRYAARADGTPLPIAAMARGIRTTRLYAEGLARGAPPDAETVQRLADATAPGLGERFVVAAAERHLLPEGYLANLALAMKMSQARNAFLLGRFVLTGSPAYFPVAFAVKTPAATLAAFVVALCLLLRADSVLRRRREVAFLLLPPIVIALASIRSSLNIGHRHLLPLYPFLYVLTGSLALALERRGGRRVATTVSLATVLVVATEMFAVRPYFLSFFNVFAGGTEGGTRLLSDSNLDWGQGLVALRRWMAARKVERINLCYFGTADAAAYGIASVPLAGSYRLDVPGVGFVGHAPEPPRVPGYVAISTTYLQGLYLSESLRRSYAFLHAKRPVAVLGGSLRVYWIDRWGE